MNNYTQGKMTWKCRKDGSLIYIIGDPNIGPHAQGDIYIGKDDLRHMAACWNACSGSKTETLELVGSDYIKPLLDLLDQRDELLSSLTTASSYMHRARLHSRDDSEEISYAVAVKKIDALIAKVKGGAA